MHYLANVEKWTREELDSIIDVEEAYNRLSPNVRLGDDMEFRYNYMKLVVEIIRYVRWQGYELASAARAKAWTLF